MDIALKRHAVIKGYIDRFWENLIKIEKDKVTSSYLKARLSLLEDYWRRYEEGHFQFIGSEDVAVTAYLKTDAYTMTENSYVLIKARITSLLKDDASTSRHDTTGTQPPDAATIQLPKISLPSFSGDQLAWESFRDLFRSLVGDVTTLAPVQKLQYLKASLSGEAAAAVANVELADAGYQLAWSELEARYDNRRVLLATHMRTFLNNPVITKPSSVELKRLSSAALKVRRSFQALGRPVDHWDDWFVHVVVEKMDPSSRMLWEASLKTSTDFSTLSHLQDFLQVLIRALEAADTKSAAQCTAMTKGDKKQRVNSLTAATPGKSAKRCALCQGDHLFSYCARFKDLTVAQRRDHVKKQGACFNCLKLKHNVSNCPSGSRCLRCGDKHHTLLHLSDTSTNSKADSPTQDSSASTVPCPDTVSGSVACNMAALASWAGSQVLLSTAQITCSNSNGDEVTIRALLDSGSEASFVTERVAQRLCLPRRRVHVPVSGIRGTSAGAANHAVALTIRSTKDRSVRLHLPSVLVLSSLTSLHHTQRTQRHDWAHLAGLTLADPEYYRPKAIDVIIGADVYGSFLREGLKLGPNDTPSAHATALGWVIMGQTSTLPSQSDSSGISTLHVAAAWDDADDALQRFWQLEELPAEPAVSPEDLQCESEFTGTHSREQQGRYTVRLPKRKDDISLGHNRREALALLIGLERWLARKPTLRDRYVDFMNEYSQLGHMAAVLIMEIRNANAYYMPHHAVFKKASDKIRVVFNASYRTSTGHSLNDLLLPGSKLQSELWATLSRWRLFTTDIVKMFRQIKVHTEDTDLQRILWCPDPAQEVRDFRLLTVVYGTASAPYLALRTLRQLAIDEGSQFPLGAKAIQVELYRPLKTSCISLKARPQVFPGMPSRPGALPFLIFLMTPLISPLDTW